MGARWHCAQRMECTRKVDVRPLGKGNPNSYGAKLVHLIITMIKRIRTCRLSMRNSLSAEQNAGAECRVWGAGFRVQGVGCRV